MNIQNVLWKVEREYSLPVEVIDAFREFSGPLARNRAPYALIWQRTGNAQPDCIRAAGPKMKLLIRTHYFDREHNRQDPALAGVECTSLASDANEPPLHSWRILTKEELDSLNQEVEEVITAGRAARPAGPS
jgi:hypothetical protein